MLPDTLDKMHSQQEGRARARSATLSCLAVLTWCNPDTSTRLVLQTGEIGSRTAYSHHEKIVTQSNQSITDVRLQIPYPIVCESARNDVPAG